MTGFGSMAFRALLILIFSGCCLRDCSASKGYEVWASDQSNSLAGQTALGVRGSYIWIFDSDDIAVQLASSSRSGTTTTTNAPPLPCTPGTTVGPCDILDIFPPTLQDGAGNLLSSLSTFGRLHGVIADPQNLYVVANMFTPQGAFVGVIEVETKEAIALFRATQYTFTTSTGTSVPSRSVHMSYWDEKNGAYIFINNLDGKAIERINVSRDAQGKITNLQFDRSAGLGLGKDLAVAAGAQVFSGTNAFGRALLGSVIGDYGQADLGNLTPAGACKEDGCSDTAAAIVPTARGGRPNNVPICPITSSGQNIYITLGGGGMFVADITQTPMKIIAEYGNQVVYGAGCGGAQQGGTIFMNSGVSAGAAGFSQSSFAVWAFADNAMGVAPVYEQNIPLPTVVFQDPANTKTGGNPNGEVSNPTGQLPGNTTRRDSHGMGITTNGWYLHVGDRIQNVIEVFDTTTYARVHTYNLTQTVRPGGMAACQAKSVTDDPLLPRNDPAPDLFSMTPDGKYLMVGLRGPAPVTVNHSSQGSCPGVGIVRLLAGGRRGKLVDVIRTTNTVPDGVAAAAIAPNGRPYTGLERSDIHGVLVVAKKTKKKRVRSTL